VKNAIDSNSNIETEEILPIFSIEKNKSYLKSMQFNSQINEIKRHDKRNELLLSPGRIRNS